VPTVRAKDFERQLALLRRCYQVVALDDMLETIRERRRGGRIPVAITFDDDLPEHLRVVAPRLRTAGLPGTFFLCGASLAAPKMFWWERMERAVDRGLDVEALLRAELQAPSGGGMEQLADQIKRSDRERRERVEAVLEQAVPGDRDEFLGTREIDELAREFRVGFHTRAHEYLPALDDARLASALREGRAELEAATGQRLRAIAYPHGGIDERVTREARAAGFELGLTTEASRVGDDPMLVGRVEPAPASLGLFWLRVERALRR
jgi:peptidoglycan/xylan/chitin deacetylase (PgdA/CDA1 family)